MKNRQMKLAKLVTKVESNVLKEFRAYAKAEGKSVSKLATEALSDYLKKKHIRPGFQNATEEVLDKNKELLKRLAK